MQTEQRPVAVVSHGPETLPLHDAACHAGFAEKIASLMEMPFGGKFDAARSYGGPVFLVPSETLSREEATGLGVDDGSRLFGGVVPAPFVATKAVAHPLMAPNARAPEGWDHSLASRLRGVVHVGFSAFTLADAHSAGRQLLTQGPARIKPTWESGSRGQSVFRSVSELEAALADIDETIMRACGVVLEQNLEALTTYSVGDAKLAGIAIAYWGTQNETLNNDGETVYGGSDLFVVRGGLPDLLKRNPPPNLRIAIEQACTFDAAVRTSYPAMFASRCNYDIAQGLDAYGEWRSGVLEQSWRIGGATGAELAAFAAFRDYASTDHVRASTVEAYGGTADPAEDASVYFCGTDPELGVLVKYTIVHERG